ncbi:MAG: hypothetical protein SFW36_22780, partial [Leptolyngbyaceae cyanobacterium bins.59]|nr:hypothetical protein [Leptolyngbyaceae cyanobacterium bins.59]
ILSQYLSLCVHQHAIAVEAGDLETARMELETARQLIQAAEQAMQLAEYTCNGEHLYEDMSAAFPPGLQVQVPVQPGYAQSPYFASVPLRVEPDRPLIFGTAPELYQTPSPSPSHPLSPYSPLLRWSGQVFRFIAATILGIAIVSFLSLIFSQPEMGSVLLTWFWPIVWRLSILGGSLWFLVVVVESLRN